MSYFQMTSMILTLCQTNSVQLDSKAEGGGGPQNPHRQQEAKGRPQKQSSLCLPGDRCTRDKPAGF